MYEDLSENFVEQKPPYSVVKDSSATDGSLKAGAHLTLHGTQRPSVSCFTICVLSCLPLWLSLVYHSGCLLFTTLVVSFTTLVVSCLPLWLPLVYHSGCLLFTTPVISCLPLWVSLVYHSSYLLFTTLGVSCLPLWLSLVLSCVSVHICHAVNLCRDVCPYNTCWAFVAFSFRADI